MRRSVLFLSLLVTMWCAAQVPDSLVWRAPKFTPQPDAERMPLGGKAYATEQWRLGNYAVALEEFERAYAEDRAKGDRAGMAGDLNQIGLILWRLNDCTSAMEAYQGAADLAEDCGEERLLGLTYLNRSILLKNQDLTDSASRMNEEALTLFRRIGAGKDEALALNNAGQIYKHVGENRLAESNYRASMAVCLALNDTDGLATAYYNLADVHARQQHADSAFHYARACAALGESVRTKLRIGEALHLLSRLHETYGRPDSALAYYKAFATYTDSLDRVNKAHALALQQARLGAEIKDLRIRGLQSEQALQRMRATAVLCGVLLVALVGALVLRRQLVRARARKHVLEAELYRTRVALGAREQELRAHIRAIAEQAAEIQRMRSELAAPAGPAPIPDADEVADLRTSKILTDDDWQAFKERFSAIYPRFFARIGADGPVLTEGEVRYMVLLRLGLAPKEMAELLGISPQSARVGKLRLKKKLLTGGHASVEDFLDRLVA